MFFRCLFLFGSFHRPKGRRTGLLGIESALVQSKKLQLLLVQYVVNLSLCHFANSHVSILFKNEKAIVAITKVAKRGSSVGCKLMLLN